MKRYKVIYQTNVDYWRDTSSEFKIDANSIDDAEDAARLILKEKGLAEKIVKLDFKEIRK